MAARLALTASARDAKTTRTARGPRGRFVFGAGFRRRPRLHSVSQETHGPYIDVISITSTVAPGIERCGLSAKIAAAASYESACTIE